MQPLAYCAEQKAASAYLYEKCVAASEPGERSGVKADRFAVQVHCPSEEQSRFYGTAASFRPYTAVPYC